MKKYYFLILLFIPFIFKSCSQAVFTPMEYAPSTSSTFWKGEKKESAATALCCDRTLLQEKIRGQKLNLAELIDIALINNPSTKKSWDEAKAAAAAYAQSLYEYFPEVDVDASYDRSRVSSYVGHISSFYGGKKASTYYRTKITPEMNISYTLYDFGQRKSSSERARMALHFADYSHNQVMQDVIQTVMRDYYDYQYQKEALKAFEADLENALTSLDAANRKFKAGVASLGDVAQARTKYLQTKIDLIAQTRAVENTFALLANDAGLPSNIEFDILDFPKNIVPDNLLESVNVLLEKANKQRQDYRARQAAVRENEEKLTYAKCVNKPKLQGSFNIGRSYFNGGAHDDYHFTAVLKLSFPLFKGFYYKNGVKIAQSNLDRSRAILEETELLITKEITTAHFNVKSAAKTVDCSKAYLEAAEERFDIALANYKMGTNTILDVLAAQSSLADARAKKAGSYREWYASLASLAYATGSLCSPKEEIYEN